MLHDNGSTHTQDADITTGSVSTQANTVTPTVSNQQGHYKVSHSTVADHCSMTLPTAPLKRPSSSVLTPDSLDRATRPVLATSRIPAEQQKNLYTCTRQCMRLHILLPVRLLHHAKSHSWHLLPALFSKGVVVTGKSCMMYVMHCSSILGFMAYT